MSARTTLEMLIKQTRETYDAGMTNVHIARDVVFQHLVNLENQLEQLNQKGK